jgi:diguanylate cyclase (GGDEF)-like protein
VLFALLGYGYFKTPVLQNHLSKALLELSIETVDDLVDETIKELTKSSDDLIRSTLLDSTIRLKNEQSLKELKRGNISSVFVVAIKDNRLFYLLDSNQNIEAGEPFQPEDMGLFLKMIQTKKRKIFIQNGIKDVGFTLMKPILQKGEVKAFILLDYTQKSLNILMRRLSTISEIIMILFISFGLIFSILGIYWVYKIHRRYARYIIPHTSVYNRRYLQDIYEKINFQDYYVALLDIDFFKRINDVYGEEQGDRVILQVMQRLSQQIGKEDILIQYGGEEFLLFVAKEKYDLQSFRYLMEDIRIDIERFDIPIAKEQLNITLSIGIVTKSENTSSLQEVIHNADEALYNAKHNGRNQICTYELSDKKQLYREKIKDMIKSDKLICYYQPIVRLVDSKPHHYEALLRLEDEGEIIYPDMILPDFEDSYFYSRIGMKIIEYNVKILRENLAFKVSINLSADDLLNDSIMALFVKNADISDRMLIEILENKHVSYQKVEITIQKLKHLGYKICIDDFGSGYSNLDHLLNLSIDYLKLDGSLIKNIHVDRRAHEIIKSLVSFSRQNHIKVIAEFVENQEILELLQEFGVEYGQGYHFCKPMPYEHFFGGRLDKALEL